MNTVTRPKADKKRIRFNSEFELCYLRHQYFRKSTANPSEAEMKPYLAIIMNLSSNTSRTYRNLLGATGFHLEDVISIARCHLVSYLGLFSLESMPEKYKEFVQANSSEESGLLDKNRANFTLFLKQRMEDLIRVCRQKARNIKGYPAEEFHIYYGQTKPPKILRNLIAHHEEYEYRKLDVAIFKSIRKRAKVNPDARAFRWNDTWYICVPIEQRSLQLCDFSGADLDPYDNAHNQNPEQVYLDSQEENYWNSKKKIFNNLPSEEKAKQMRSFIAKHDNSKAYSDELKAAKRILLKLETEWKSI